MGRDQAGLTKNKPFIPRRSLMKRIASAISRRSIIKASAAAGLVQVTSPFIISARGETPVKIGMVDPFTGVYAAIAQGEAEGAKLAIEHINKKGGILGREAQLLLEDSANDVGTGVQKTRKLIERAIRSASSSATSIRASRPRCRK